MLDSNLKPLEFSLTPWAKEELAYRLQPIRIKRLFNPSLALDTKEVKLLVRAIKDTFPPEAFLMLDDMANEHTSRPVLVHNLPKDNFDAVRGQDKLRPQSFSDFYIAQAIYHYLNAQPDIPQLLKRKSGRKLSSAPAGGDVHTDPWVLSSLSCPDNSENAPTRFFDWRGVVAEAQKERLAERIQADYGESVIALADYFALTPKDIGNNAINLIEDDSAELQRFKQLLDKRKSDIVLQPGDLAIWNNRTIFHQAHNGNYEQISPERYSRVALFCGADR